MGILDTHVGKGPHVGQHCPNVWYPMLGKKNYPSVTLTRSFFTTWVGISRGFLWTGNCVATFGLATAGFFGLAIAWRPLDSPLRVSFGLAIAWRPLDSPLRVSLDWQLRGDFWTRHCGFLWTGNCVATFGLATAGFLWTGNCV